MSPTLPLALQVQVYFSFSLIIFPCSLLGLETQLGPVVAAISKNKSIKKLNIGRNLNNIKSKHVYHVMEAVVQMIQVRRRAGQRLTV